MKVFIFSLADAFKGIFLVMIGGLWRLLFVYGELWRFLFTDGVSSVLLCKVSKANASEKMCPV